MSGGFVPGYGFKPSRTNEFAQTVLMLARLGEMKKENESRQLVREEALALKQEEDRRKGETERENILKRVFPEATGLALDESTRQYSAPLAREIEDVGRPLSRIRAIPSKIPQPLMTTPEGTEIPQGPNVSLVNYPGIKTLRDVRESAAYAGKDPRTGRTSPSTEARIRQDVQQALIDRGIEDVVPSSEDISPVDKRTPSDKALAKIALAPRLSIAPKDIDKKRKEMAELEGVQAETAKKGVESRIALDTEKEKTRQEGVLTTQQKEATLAGTLLENDVKKIDRDFKPFLHQAKLDNDAADLQIKNETITRAPNERIKLSLELIKNSFDIAKTRDIIDKLEENNILSTQYLEADARGDVAAKRQIAKLQAALNGHALDVEKMSDARLDAASTAQAQAANHTAKALIAMKDDPYAIDIIQSQVKAANSYALQAAQHSEAARVEILVPQIGKTLIKGTPFATMQSISLPTSIAAAYVQGRIDNVANAAINPSNEKAVADKVEATAWKFIIENPSLKGNMPALMQKFDEIKGLDPQIKDLVLKGMQAKIGQVESKSISQDKEKPTSSRQALGEPVSGTRKLEKIESPLSMESIGTGIEKAYEAGRSLVELRPRKPKVEIETKKEEKPLAKIAPGKPPEISLPKYGSAEEPLKKDPVIVNVTQKALEYQKANNIVDTPDKARDFEQWLASISVISKRPIESYTVEDMKDIYANWKASH